jgi:hypothetical protein
VEVLAFRVLSKAALAYRRLTGELHGGRHPDGLARELLGLTPHTTAHLMHSTSWRHEPASRVILTYGCCPDPHPHLPATPLRARSLARSAGPTAPSPDEVSIGQVAAHAVRHLAFLEHTDPAARRLIESVPALAGALARWSPVAAGQLPTSVSTG